MRKVEKESGEYIDLLTGTGLGGISKDTIGQFVDAFAQMPGTNMPEIETEINGPALEIVPIAVFV